MGFRILFVRDYRLYGEPRRAGINIDVLALAAHVAEHVSARLNAQPMPDCRLSPEMVAAIREVEPDLPIPLLDAPNSDIDIEVVLTDDPEVYEAASLADDADPDGCEGFFAVHGDAFEGSAYSTRFRVFWRSDQERLLSFLREDVVTQADLVRCVESWLATIPHELCHVVDWIANTGGLTPADVDLLAHHGVLTVEDALVGPHADIEALEDAVERQARQIMADISIPSGLFHRVATKAGVLGFTHPASISPSHHGEPA